MEWISELLAHPELLSERSRQSQVSRQTLYRWKAKGEHALQESLQFQPVPSKRTPVIERAVLTLLVEGHASYRGIQDCLHELLGIEVSLGTISAIAQNAGKQAQRCLAKLVPISACALALDEHTVTHGGSLSQCGGCPQFPGVGESATRGRRWRELDPGLVVSAGARSALANNGERWWVCYRRSVEANRSAGDPPTLLASWN